MAWLETYFDRVVLINLPRRVDRLDRVKKTLADAKWPFRTPEIFPAVDGRVVPARPGWKAGGGAWGCLRSHQRILEETMLQGADSVLILEDDVTFVEEFAAKVEAFLRQVPDDWDQLMLGGQHVNVVGRPVLIKPGVYRCSDCERTHCYAVRGAYLRLLYERWSGGGEFDGKVHCDWIMGRDVTMQSSHQVYAPERFLAGQNRGPSDINGGIHPCKFWNPPDPGLPVIHLEAPVSVVADLRLHGFHTGFMRNHATDLDAGLEKLVRESAPGTEARRHRLSDWLNEIQWEVASDPFLLCTVWHPGIGLEAVQKASRWKVHAVKAESVEQALGQLPPELRRVPRIPLARTHVIHLEAPRYVMDAMRGHGWHNGHWRNREGLDRGLCEWAGQDLPPPERRERLAAFIRLLQKEAEAIGEGIAVIWHPRIGADDVRAATNAEVVSVAGDDLRSVLDQWEELRRRQATSAKKSFGI